MKNIIKLHNFVSLGRRITQILTPWAGEIRRSPGLNKTPAYKRRRCEREDCFACTSEGTGNCNREGITYKIECLGDCEERNIYKGESADNGYTRGKSHINDLQRRDTKNSPLWRHCRDIHNSRQQEFKMSVTGTFKDDAMLRQITEAVQIENLDPERLMNSRTEWNMTRVPRATIT